MMPVIARFLLSCTVCVAALAPAADVTSMPANLLLPPSEDNPRNSEGDFIQLNDGRVLFVYTHFTGGAGDHATAHLAGRFSADGGATWDREDTVIVPYSGGRNIMSVSLLRLQDGSIALLYLKKVEVDECIPMFLRSTDEARSWSDPVACITDPLGYYVVNNDRLVQLKSGRLLIPTARHVLKGQEGFFPGQATCAISDDNGATWRMSDSLLSVTPTVKSGLQEPLVLELLDGRVLMLCRTSDGAQYRSLSADGGVTWSEPARTNLLSPTSPATVERIPGGNDLLLVWNDHTVVDASLRGKRTPLRAAISPNDGHTWHVVKTLEDLADGWYCYIAMDFVEDYVLLGYCAGDRRVENGLQTTKVIRLPLNELRDAMNNARIIKEDF